MTTRTTPVDRNLMRAMNLKLVLNLIRLHGPVSRPRLIELSGLSLGTIVGITAELLKKQYVIEREMLEATGSSGRKPGLLEMNPDRSYALGLSLVEDGIAIVLLDLMGQVIISEQALADLSSHKQPVVATLAQSVETFLMRHEIAREKVIGLGCGLPGHVNAQTGISIDDWIHDWHDLSIAEPLSALLQMPVWIDNVVNCLATHERLFGQGRQYQDFLVVTLGLGVGLAMVIRGEAYRGSAGGGGEFGHIPIVAEGRTCACGNQGCLEAYISDAGLLTSYRERRRERDQTSSPTEITTLTHLLEAARRDKAAAETLVEGGTWLGYGLATLVNLFNPECIIFTGTALEPDGLLFHAMQEALQRHTFARLGAHLALIVEPSLAHKWAQGAGCLVLQHFFRLPL